MRDGHQGLSLFTSEMKAEEDIVLKGVRPRHWKI